MTGWIITGAVVLLFVVLLASSAVVEVEYRDKLSVKIKYLMFTVIRFPESPKKLRKKKQKERRKEEKELAKKRKALLKKQKKQGKEPDKALSEAASLARELQMGADEQPQAEEPQDISVQDNVEAKAENNTGSAKKQEKKPKPKKKKQDLGKLLEQVKLFVSSAKKPLLKLIKSIRINVHDLKITAGGDDAAKAALNYGKINMLVGNAIGWLDSIMTLKIRDIDIGIDFQKEETVYSGKGTVKIRLFTAIVCGLAFFINMTKNTLNSDKNGGIKNGRTSNSRADEHGNAKNKRAG